MLKKLEKTWKDLDRSIIVNKRELVLGVTACTLAGVVLGVFLSPRKNQTFGSYNGNHSAGSVPPRPPFREPEIPRWEPEKATPEREAEEA